MVTASYFRAVGIGCAKVAASAIATWPALLRSTVETKTMARNISLIRPHRSASWSEDSSPGNQTGAGIGGSVGIVADERVHDLDNKRDNPGILCNQRAKPVYFGGLGVRSAIDPSGWKKSHCQAFMTQQGSAAHDFKTLADQIPSRWRATGYARCCWACSPELRCYFRRWGICVISYSVAQHPAKSEFARLGPAAEICSASFLRMNLDDGSRAGRSGIRSVRLDSSAADATFRREHMDPLTIIRRAPFLAALGC